MGKQRLRNWPEAPVDALGASLTASASVRIVLHTQSLPWAGGQGRLEVKEPVRLGAACKLQSGDTHAPAPSLPAGTTDVRSPPHRWARVVTKVTCRMRHRLVFPCLPHFPTPQLLLPDTIPQINNFLRLSSWRTSHIEG